MRSRARIIAIVKDELIGIKDEFGTPRRTEILETEGEVEDEDLIQREDMVVTVSHKGYIKRVPLSTYRAQRRGGKGRAGMATRDEDFVTRLFVANTHTPVLFFSSRGMAYKMKVWRLPVAAPQARGKALINLLPLDKDESITTILPLPEDEGSWDKLDVMFATNGGNVRRNKLSDFVEVRQNGKIAMKLDEGDGIVGVEICDEQQRRAADHGGGAGASASPSPTCACSRAANRPACAASSSRASDQVISMAILAHVEASPAERAAYLRQANMVRRGGAADQEQDMESEGNGQETVVLSPERYAELSAHEQFVLTVSENGYGKRTLRLRIPHLRPRRQRHHRHGRQPAERQAGRLLPGGGERPDHAGHRPRPAHPRAGRRHQHRRPLDARRDRVRHRRGRARGRGRAHPRRREWMATRTAREAQADDELDEVRSTMRSGGG